MKTFLLSVVLGSCNRMINIKKYIVFLLIVVLSFYGCNFKSNNSFDKKENDVLRYEWQLEYIHAPNVWSKTKGKTITIAVIDSGINYNLLGTTFDKTRIIASYNAYDENEDMTDYTSHGTSMISLIGSNGENGFYGVAPECKFIIIKALNGSGMTNSDVLVKAINFAIKHKANIINLSLGSEKEDSLVAEAINAAFNQNIIVTGAIGDNGKETICFPASLDTVLGVGAIDCNGKLYSKSNYNNYINVIAPGVDVMVPRINIFNETVNSLKSGSSIATAIFSGYLALYLDYIENYTVEDIYLKFSKLCSLDLANVI